MIDEQRYNEWIANRQTAKPSTGLADVVMATVEDRVSPRRYARLTDRLNDSLPIRWAACVVALLIGSLPFFYIAYAAKLIML